MMMLDMANQQNRSPFGDTTHTKVFVGGLAWETHTDEMRRYFEQFGEILEAVIITDKNTGKSKGYGFVTFSDPESARRACADPNPIIDGRRANCNIAAVGRPRTSPPRGRNESGNYQGGAVPQAPTLPPLPPPPPPMIYPPYGYASYSPDYGYHQTIYNPQLHHHQPQYYQHHLYGNSSSTMGVSPYYYGYSTQASRGFSAPPQGQSYIYYPTTQMEGSFSYTPTHFPQFQPTRHTLPSSNDSQNLRQTSIESEVGAATSESPKTQKEAH